MEPYYLGGYFLIKNELFGWSPDTNGIVQTCSGCINIRVFDDWCLSWVNGSTERPKEKLGLTDETIRAIQTWGDQQFDDGNVRWGDVFSNLETVQAFKNLFFANRDDLYIQAIYLSEPDTHSLIVDFDQEVEKGGRFGIWQNLGEKVREVPDSAEELLGYDLIGVDIGGSFHSFHCHGIGKELAGRFGLTLNQHGLFSHIPDPQAVRAYLNNGTAPVEPVPWYIAKTKRLKTAGS